MKAKYIKCIIAVIFAIVSIPSLADSFEEGGLWYEIDINNNSNLIVAKAPSGYSYSEKAYVIPNNVYHNGNSYRVIKIGDQAFDGCRSLESITFPNSLTEIGYRSFASTSVSTIDLPSSVSKIGNYAFSSCSKLEYIKLSSSLSNIGTQAFNGCSFSEIVIPGSVTQIGEALFHGCNNLVSIVVESGVYDSRNNCNAICKDDTLVVGCSSSTIPNGIRIIGDEAFDGCRSLESISFPNSLIEIGYRSFASTSVSTIDLPSSVSKIGNYAFSSCSKLEYIKLSSSLSNIGTQAFNGCSFSEIVIPGSVTQIGEALFHGCNNLVSIVVESGVYDSRNNCNAICKDDTLVVGCSSSTIPNGIRIIGNEAFDGCRSLESVSFPSSLTEIGYRSFASTSISTVNLPSSVVKIGNYAFSSCSKLSDVFSLNVSPSKIDVSVFNNIDKNATLHVPVGTISAYYEYEGWIKNFKNIVEFDPYRFEVDGIYYNIDEANPDVVSVTQGDVEYSGAITIPSTVTYNGKTMKVTTIGEKAFFKCRELVSVKLPGTIIQIGKHAFQHCDKLTTINLPSSLIHICLDAFANCISLSELNLPSSLTDIDPYAFFGSNLSNILIPKSTIRIGHAFLSGCKNLASIQVEDGNPVYDSRNSCNAIFKGDTLVAGCKNTILPQGIKVIGIEALSFLSGVTKISLPSTITTIGAAAFRDGFDLYSVELPVSVSEIAKSAFEDCYQLSEVTSFIEEVFVIDESVFKGAYDKATLYVPKGKVSEYRQTAGWCLFKTICEIPDDPTTECEGVIYAVNTKNGKARVMGCLDNLYHAIIQESIGFEGNTYAVDEVCDSAFANKEVVSILFPKSVLKIGTGLFNGCSHLSAIDWQVTRKPSAELVKNVVNPNLLFYVTSEAYKPDNIRNIIVDGNTDEITLMDSEPGGFHCMKTFTAKKISYTHKYSLKTEKDVSEGWEAIALPFDVQTYMTPKGEAKPYKVANAGERLFWLRELTASGMVEAEGIKANVPYIISMPNWEGYQDFYNIKGDVEFSAQNVTIDKTDIQPVSWNGRHFWPCYGKKTDYYALAAINKEFKSYYNTSVTYLPGSVFIIDHRDILPFEAYIEYDNLSSARPITIAEMCGEATSIDKIEPDSVCYKEGYLIINALHNGVISIYSATGQLRKTINVKKGYNAIDTKEFSSGVYIVAGKKVIMK